MYLHVKEILNIFYPSMLMVTLDIIIWILDTFDDYLEIENALSKYLKESC